MKIVIVSYDKAVVKNSLRFHETDFVLSQISVFFILVPIQKSTFSFIVDDSKETKKFFQAMTLRLIAFNRLRFGEHLPKFPVVLRRVAFAVNQRVDAVPPAVSHYVNPRVSHSFG